MQVHINNDIDLEKWDRLLSKSNLVSPFQTFQFYQSFKSIGSLDADVFAIEYLDDYEALVVVTVQKEIGLKSFFSKRGIIYGGPVVKTNNSLKLLLDVITKFYKNKLIYIEIRNLFDYSFCHESFSICEWSYQPWLNFQIQLSDKNQVIKNLSKTRLRQLNKAKINECTWKEVENIDEVREFYKILYGLYQSKIKKPLLPLEYFVSFYSDNHGKILVVCYKEKIIGGIVCPLIPEDTIYEFYICGLDVEYKSQYPSVMATWAGIEFGINNGFKLFDFMGAGSPLEEYSVREFKKRFGGVQVEHGRYLKVLNPILFRVGKLGLSLIKLFQA